MTDDELLLIYSSMRKFTDGMNAREQVLDQKVAALDAAIAQLQQLPLTLGKQTSQYIAMGVRQSIQDDFSRPIEESVKKPLADFSREVYHARDVISKVGDETAFRTWVWIAVFVAVGIFLGSMGTWWMFNRDLDRVNVRLDAIQRQIAPPAPVTDSPGPQKTPANSLHSGPSFKSRHPSHAQQPAVPSSPDVPETPQ